MTAYFIRAVGFANGAPCPHEGEYLKSFDHDTPDGLGYGEFTRDLSEAKLFASRARALEFWRRPSRSRPLRPDGEPNRPLTCLTVAVEPLP
jgi:hypothetical protein